jgi:hypothetical protein
LANLLTEKLHDELLVYDEQRDLACRLNQTAATVWRASDGQRTVEDLVEVLREQIGDAADEDLVMLTLDRLEESGLLDSGYPERDSDQTAVSRRRFLGRVGVAGAAAMVLPVVDTIVAPTPAAAASGNGSTGPTGATGATGATGPHRGDGPALTWRGALTDATGATAVGGRRRYSPTIRTLERDRRARRPSRPRHPNPSR